MNFIAASACGAFFGTTQFSCDAISPLKAIPSGLPSRMNGAARVHDVSDEFLDAVSFRLPCRHYGGLHILHNNAGGSTPVDSTVVEVPIEEFWRAIRLDLFGTFLGCRFGIPAIIASGGGSVINMASNVALMGVAGRDCYTAAKGGIAAITRSMAVEFAPCESTRSPRPRQ